MSNPSTPGNFPPLERLEDEDLESFVKRLRLSTRGYKSHLTIVIKSLQNTVDLFEAGPSSYGALQLHQGKVSVENALLPLSARLQQLIENADTEKNLKSYEDDLVSYSESANKMAALATKLIGEHGYSPLEGQVTEKPKLQKKTTTNDEEEDFGDEDDDGSAKRPPRLNSAMRPEKLSIESKPEELRSWLDQFRTYFATSGMDELTYAIQQSYFLQCLGKDLRGRVEETIDKGTTPVFGDGDSCISTLQAIFLKRYPLFKRRLSFFDAGQARGQLMSSYYIELRKLHREADITKLTAEDLLLYKLLCGCINEEMRKELFRLKKPTLQEVLEFIDAWEVGTVSNKTVKTGGGATAKASQAKQQKKTSDRSWGKTIEEIKANRKKAIDNGACAFCCSKSHKKPDCKHTQKPCTNCNLKGHPHYLCFKGVPPGGESKKNQKASQMKKQDAAQEATDDESTEKAGRLTYRVAVAKSILKNPTPKLLCKVVPYSGDSFEHEVIPDTGATITVVSKKIAKRNNMKITPANQEKLIAADDTPMNVSGITRFTINETPIRALVSSSVTDDILVCWRDMIRLGIIHPNFPEPQFSSCLQVSDPTPEDITSIEARKDKLFEEYADVLCDTLPEKPMKGPLMDIKLRTDLPVKPRFATTTKPLPTHYEEQAKTLVDKLVKDGVVEEVPLDEICPWISPAFFVPKEGGKAGLRLVTDFTHLNRYVQRPVHPFPSAGDIARGISPGSNWFCKMDAVQGYHQIPLSEEAKKLTTFLLPWGKYRYCRGPMGLSSTNDCWCGRSDQAICGLPNCRKIVDDILVTASNLKELFDSIEKILKNCREIGLTISKRKFKIHNEVSFAGYLVSSTGVKPDPAKVEAIRDFPAPKDLTSLRSFLGLANQLGHFIPDLAMATCKMRGLLKKGVVYMWLPEHEQEFHFVKELLTSPLLVHYFDPTLPTTLLTDASKLNGLGYALIQHDEKGALRLIQAGSRGLTPAERNYAPIESEMLGAVWAMGKCRYFLHGCPTFKLATDHQPLVGIFKKELNDIPNRRLQRLREKVVDFSFEVEWVEGKTHLIADALSRHPLDTQLDDQAYLVSSVLHSLDPSLDLLRTSASNCSRYKRLLDAVQTMDPKTVKKLPDSDPIALYKPVWQDLSVHDDGQLVLYQTDRIVIPIDERPRLLSLLHLGHSGIGKTRELAKQLYYWPGMSNDIKNLVSSCPACLEHLPSQPSQPLQTTKSTFPLEHTSADLFSYAGKDFLVWCDRFSGMVWCNKLTSTTTDKVTSTLMNWFIDFGYPKSIRTDGGPQFRGPFDEWCKQNGIIHELSSPYHPQSNGHAEAGVKVAKRLVQKLDANMRHFHSHLFAWRNTPRPDGFAPADLFFGRRLRSALPSVSASTSTLPDVILKREKAAQQAASRHDIHSRSLSALLPGAPVRVQTPAGTWGEETAIVVKARRPDGLSYVIKLGDKEMIRNRKFLRPIENPDV